MYCDEWENDEQYREYKESFYELFFITEYKWRLFSPELRKKMLKIYDKSHYVDKYAGNVANLLRMSGEYELEEQFREEVATLMMCFEKYGRMKP